MIKIKKMEPQFVVEIPRQLEPGRLYVSMEYATVVHSCCCGCGLEIVTPLTPTDWELNYDGEAISLWPSVGNWHLPCESHYVIRRNRVIDAGPWPATRIDAERRRDKAAKAEFYGRVDADRNGRLAIEEAPEIAPLPPPSKRAKRLRRWFDWR